MRLPCMVNSALYCEKLSSEAWGEESWSRMNSAMIPGEVEQHERRDHVAHAR